MWVLRLALRPVLGISLHYRTPPYPLLPCDSSSSFPIVKPAVSADYKAIEEYVQFLKLRHALDRSVFIHAAQVWDIDRGAVCVVSLLVCCYIFVCSSPLSFRRRPP